MKIILVLIALLLGGCLTEPEPKRITCTVFVGTEYDQDTLTVKDGKCGK